MTHVHRVYGVRSPSGAFLDRVDAVRNLHRPEVLTDIEAYDCLQGNCEHEDECPTETVTVCRECHGIAYEMNDEVSVVPIVYYPCPTIRALDGVA